MRWPSWSPATVPPRRSRSAPPASACRSRSSSASPAPAAASPPDLLLLAARTVDRPPAAGLMIGDTDRDLQAGRAAGMKTCGVGWGVLGADGLRPHDPDYVIARFDELRAIVTG